MFSFEPKLQQLEKLRCTLSSHVVVLNYRIARQRGYMP